MPEDLEPGKPKSDLLIAPLCEAGLLLIVGVVAWLIQRPLIFATLGPTAFELIETPNKRSARPYSVIVGNLIGVLSGFLALYLTRAWFVPIASLDRVPLLRIWAAALAAILTVAGTLLARATQPAALAGTLLIALGLMQRPMDGVYMMAGVLLLDLIGEPMRRLRAVQRARHEGRACQERDGRPPTKNRPTAT
jgi:hypothetical protein